MGCAQKYQVLSRDRHRADGLHPSVSLFYWDFSTILPRCSDGGGHPLPTRGGCVPRALDYYLFKST
ncbi:hypothetical protein AAG906_023518 [Vitis piasezkii]